MYVLLVPFVTEVLHGDTIHVGGLMSSQAVGGIIGGILISWIAPRVKMHQLLGYGAIIFGLVDLALFNYSTFFSSILIAYGLILLAGPLAVAIGAGYNTMVQSNVEDAYRGRVFGTFGVTGSLFNLIGIALAGGAADRLGIVPVINVQGYVYILIGVISLLMLRDNVSGKITKKYADALTVEPTT
jgi:MFS family permease